MTQALRCSLALVKKVYLLVERCELTSIDAGVLADSADGNYVSDTIYDDANPDQIETLPDTQLHRDVDLELIKADKEGTLDEHSSILICLEINKYLAYRLLMNFMAGYVKVYIVLPSVIYGLATGELVEQGIQNPHSFISQLTKIALDRGRSGIVGAGLNVWPNVNIQEREDPTISLIIRANIVQSR